MKRLFLIAIVTLLAISNVDAQSKKELKAQAKRQEVIYATTDPKDGARWFMMDKKMLHIRAKVRDCYVSGTTVIVKLLIYNREPRDETLKFVGELYSNARDDEDNYISSRNVSFAIGDSGRFEHDLNNVFIPGGLATLKVTMKIENVNPNIAQFNDLKFGLISTLSGGTRTYINTIYDLDIRR